MSGLAILRWDGQPISQPGVYVDVPMEAYHGDLCVGPSVSSSGLKKIFWDSPKDYFDTSYLNPDRDDTDDNENFIFGRAAHHLLLGQSEFDKHFVIRPAQLNGQLWNSNRNDCKAWLEHVRGQGLTVLLASQIEHIKGMRAGLAEDPLVRAGLLNGEIERSFVWQDAETGVWLKWRPDAFPTASLDFGDLKSAASVSDKAIQKAMDDFAYNMQAALGAMACREVLGQEMSSFNLVFSQKKRPYSARTRSVYPEDIAIGETQVRAAIRMFARSLETGRWIGPGGTLSDAQYVGLSDYARKRAEARLLTIEQELADL